MHTYHIWTIGCQMNEADSQRLAGALERMGLSETPRAEEADVIVLNSCVVRQGAEDKVVGRLTSLQPLKRRSPDRVIALMGCMVPPRNGQLARRFPYVDVFMQPQQFTPLLEHLERVKGLDSGCVSDLVPPRPSVATHVPIIHGCDKFCTFCIIPYRRGRERSRPVDEIVREVTVLVQRGVKEVTLLGQNVDSYGHDLPGAPDLADLLAAVNDVPGLMRVRFLTSHPNDMSERIIKAVAALPKVCEYINLPAQAGDDAVLAAMKRGYTNADYRDKVKLIRDTVPNVTLTTDIIVGFPGETEEQFMRTYELLEDIRFDKVHIAAYSTRPGTIAARTLVDDVPPEEKKRRVKALEEQQERIATQLNAALLDTVQEVLVEGAEDGMWHGRTRGNKLVHFPHPHDLTGQLVNVRIEKTSPWSLQGKAVHNPALVS